MAIEFVTRQFEIAHGRRPKGYGMWMFCPLERWAQMERGGVDYLDHVVSFTGKYADAKRSARAYFASRGVSAVVVCD